MKRSFPFEARGAVSGAVLFLSVVAASGCGTTKTETSNPDAALAADASLGSDAPVTADALDAIADSVASDADPFACPVPAFETCPGPAPHFAAVEPIFREHCVPCHSGLTNGPWPLRDYESIAPWQDVISAQLSTCGMPPSGGGIPLSAADRSAILTWIGCGFLK